MNKKLIIILFTLIMGGLLTVAIFSQRGVLHMVRLKEELRQLEDYNSKLKAENFALKKEIEQLKYNSNYLEDLARDELGLAKENELIYELKKKNK